jgi:hypothetical protein
MMYLISRFTDSCAFIYQFPSAAPRNATPRPGNTNIGVNNTIAPSFMRHARVRSMTPNMAEDTEVSTTRISCVHLAIIRAVGVSSSHLSMKLIPEDELSKCHKPEGAPEDRVDQFRMNSSRRRYSAVIEK